MVPDTVDPLQFTYRPNRSVDDAVAVTLHHTLQRLERGRTYASILGLIKEGDESGYRALVDNILAYGEENDLILNINETK